MHKKYQWRSSEVNIALDYAETGYMYQCPNSKDIS